MLNIFIIVALSFITEYMTKTFKPAISNHKNGNNFLYQMKIFAHIFLNENSIEIR